MSPQIDLGRHCDVITTPGMGENLPPGMPGGGLMAMTSVSKWREATR